MAFMAFIKPNKINFFLEGESPTLMKKRKKKNEKINYRRRNKRTKSVTFYCCLYK